MWSGDSLNVVLWLGGVAIAAVLGAITAPTGWRSTTLWLIALAFAIATLAWIVAPTASPAIQAVSPLLVTIATSNAVFMVAVVGVVALMIGGRNPPSSSLVDPNEVGSETAQPPAFAAQPTTKWKPDITIEEGVGYVGARSTWRNPYGINTVDSVTSELSEALAAKKITAWGREHPAEGELFEIKSNFWLRADITLDKGYAFSHRLGVGAYDIHVCQSEMEHVWPPKQR